MRRTLTSYNTQQTTYRGRLGDIEGEGPPLGLDEDLHGWMGLDLWMLKACVLCGVCKGGRGSISRSVAHETHRLIIGGKGYGGTPSRCVCVCSTPPRIEWVTRLRKRQQQRPPGSLALAMLLCIHPPSSRRAPQEPPQALHHLPFDVDAERANNQQRGPKQQRRSLPVVWVGACVRHGVSAGHRCGVCVRVPHPAFCCCFGPSLVPFPVPSSANPSQPTAPERPQPIGGRTTGLRESGRGVTSRSLGPCAIALVCGAACMHASFALRATCLARGGPALPAVALGGGR